MNGSTSSKQILLQFQRDIIDNAIDNRDGLYVLAPGLGICQLVAVLLKLEDEKRKFNPNEGGVTIIVGADQSLREAIQSEMLRIHPKSDWFDADSGEEGTFPKHVTADVPTAERLRLYASSSCVFVTTRILVVDLLSGRLNADSISGLIVMNAHHVTESSGEGFVVKLYRSKGGKGFVRAFSENPVSFTSEFSKAEKTLRALHSSNLQIWPRFRTVVQDDFEGKAPELIEISVLTDAGAGIIYEAIAELLDISVKELRKHEKLDTTDLSPTQGLMRAFDEIVKRQLAPVWHTVSPKIRQLVDDMKTLRNLANFLLKFDAVTYLKYLENLRVTDGSKSAWMFHSAAHIIFEAAKNRVYKIEGLERKPEEVSTKRRVTEIKPVLEELPKWKAVLEIVFEIMDEPEARLPILIFCEDEYTVDQLQKVIKPDGPKDYMESMYLTYLDSKVDPKKAGSKRNASGNAINLLPHSQIEELALYKEAKEIQKLRKVAGHGNQSNPKAAVSQTSMSEWFEKNLVFIPSDPAGHAALWRYHPSRIIVYDPDIALIRQIELYSAQQEEEKARVYLLRYEPSPELDKYHARLVRERDAFEDLIKTKGSMALNISDSEVKFTPIERADNSVSANSISRKGGGRVGTTMEKIRVIVDVREFMSTLPAVLYSQGYSLVPVTLEVGDYILSPEICVERKTIPDLRGSLQSGRLYQQAEAMCKHYSISILLIEFDGEKAFALQAAAELGEDIQPGHIMSRLVLLCLHHPRLRLVWSRSLHATADLFRQLKANYDEPDPTVAGNVGLEGNQPAINTTAIDMLRKLPGVNDSNFRGLCKEAGSLAGLANLSLARLSTIMGSEVSGKRLYDFLHQKSTL